MDILKINAVLRERHTLPEDFHFYNWEILPHPPEEANRIEVTGERAPLKENGDPNFRKAIKGTRQKFVMSMHEAEAVSIQGISPSASDWLNKKIEKGGASDSGE